MTSQEHSGDSCNIIFGQNKKKIGILEILFRSIVRHQNRKKLVLRPLAADVRKPSDCCRSSAARDSYLRTADLKWNSETLRQLAHVVVSQP